MPLEEGKRQTETKCRCAEQYPNKQDMVEQGNGARFRKLHRDQRAENEMNPLWKYQNARKNIHVETNTPLQRVDGSLPNDEEGE